MDLQKFTIDRAFELESGEVLPRIDVAYHTWGELNAEKNNVVWVCHALTGNSNAADWWPWLVGPGKFIDPQRDYIVCANMLGSCYGSSGPLSIDPNTGEPYYGSFPIVTVRDTVKALAALRAHLGIDKIRLAIGGSMGGQQVLEWAIEEPDVLESVVPVATNARHSPWGIAFNEAQRMALEADPTLNDRSATAGQNGMAAARAIGMVSYRAYETFGQTQRDEESRLEDFRASSYLRYQGAKLVKRFNAQSYRLLSKAMDAHDVGRGRGRIEDVLKSIKARALVIGVSSDILFPTSEQKYIASHIPGAKYVEVESIYGHDGFLIEERKITDALAEFCKRPEGVRAR